MTTGKGAAAAAPTIPAGTRVRFTADRLGLVEHPGAFRFEPETVGTGDEGIYREPHVAGDLVDWHLIDVRLEHVPHPPGEARELVAPCHRSQFEVIS